MQRLLFSLLFIFLNASAYALDDPWMQIEKASQAARQLSYKGIFVYQNYQEVRSIEITHLNNGNEEFARIVSLDGPPRELLSRGDNVVVFNPNKENVFIQKRQGQNLFPAILPSNINIVKSSYNLRFGDQERIGGREAQIVYLDPRDEYRYPYKLWLDKEFGLLLKMMILDHHQKIIEQASFNQVALFASQDLNWFKPSIDTQKKYLMDEAPENITSNEKYCVISNLPAGYREVSHVTRMIGRQPQLVHQWIFSDGLSSVSLFVNPRANRIALMVASVPELTILIFSMEGIHCIIKDATSDSRLVGAP
ncbi:MAG: transcriptional regulator [Proteobacteria bacterium]|nr:transcriptional regulator [Pseudomonadota bacterium]